MKIGQQAKPRLQIIKNMGKHNYRTQENSPIEFGEHQVKFPGSVEITMPQVARITERVGFGVRGIRSLQNSK